ncbi:MAG TPA: hypothetical protein VIY48_04485 [Candidatus Paceibacterota bacterium]
MTLLENYIDAYKKVCEAYRAAGVRYANSDEWDHDAMTDFYEAHDTKTQVGQSLLLYIEGMQ